MVYKDYFSIIDYYKKVVIPINPRKFRVKSDKMMLCPLHDDKNPSMGVILNSEGQEIYHCFGCNRWGDIVDLHKKVSRIYFKRYLSDEDSLKDLCKIFDVPFEKVDICNQSSDSNDVKIDMAIDSAMEKYDISDYKRMITEGKLKKKGIGYYNTITMMMVNELKKQEC